MATNTNTKNARLYIVSAGFLFILLIVFLAKVVKSGELVTVIFLGGLIVFSGLVFWFFSRYSFKEKE